MENRNIIPGSNPSNIDITFDEDITDINLGQKVNPGIFDTEEDEVDPVDEELEDDQTEKDSEVDQDEDDFDVDSLTEGQAFYALLSSNGVEIYDQAPDDISMSKIAEDIPAFIKYAIETEVNQAKELLGKYKDYYELEAQGVSKEQLNPALELENYLNLDLNSPQVSTADLVNLVKQMHLRRGLDDSEATALANMDSKDPVMLQSKAEKAQDFFSNYIENIKSTVMNQKQSEIQQQQERFKSEHDGFLNELNQTSLDRDAKQSLYDLRYKRDQIISYVDDSGKEVRDMVTKYDILMYQLNNNPTKLISVLNFMQNDFTDAKSDSSNYIQNKALQKLKDRLDGRSQVRETQQSNSRNTKNQKTVKPVGMTNFGFSEIDLS